MGNYNQQIRRISVFDKKDHREITFQQQDYQCKWSKYEKYESIQIRKINTALLKKKNDQEQLKIAEINGKPEDISHAFAFIELISEKRKAY